MLLYFISRSATQGIQGRRLHEEAVVALPLGPLRLEDDLDFLVFPGPGENKLSRLRCVLLCCLYVSIVSDRLCVVALLFWLRCFLLCVYARRMRTHRILVDPYVYVTCSCAYACARAWTIRSI